MRDGVGRACLDSSGKADGGDGEIDQLDADERHHDATQAVDQDIAAQETGRAQWPVIDAAECERDERNDDQRVKDDRRQDRALRLASPMMLRACSCG